MSEDFPARSQSHHDVFISYAQEDKVIADAVCARLESHHIRCWIAPRDVTYAKDFPEAIIEGIDGSRILVLIFSSHANKSPHVIRELTNAVNKGRIIAPFRIEDVIPSKSMEYLISVPHWLDAITPPLEKHIDDLAGTIKRILSSDKEPVVCTVCKTPLSSSTQFCGVCGNPVSPGTQAISSQPAPVAEPTPPAPPQPVPEPGTIRTIIPERPAIVPKRPVKMYLAAGIILIALIAIVLEFQSGLISLPVQVLGAGSHDNASVNPPTPLKNIDYRSSDAVVNTVVLTTMPTQAMAKDTELVVDVIKDSSTAMVTVQFAGGPGMGLVRSNRVILTRSDGTVAEGTLNFNQRMSEVQLQGTRGTDRIQVEITTFPGEVKTIMDQLLPYRQYR
jgi:hypothetical protein